MNVIVNADGKFNVYTNGTRIVPIEINTTPVGTGVNFDIDPETLVPGQTITPSNPLTPSSDVLPASNDDELIPGRWYYAIKDFVINAASDISKMINSVWKDGAEYCYQSISVAVGSAWEIAKGYIFQVIESNAPSILGKVKVWISTAISKGISLLVSYFATPAAGVVAGSVAYTISEQVLTYFIDFIIDQFSGST